LRASNPRITNIILKPTELVPWESKIPEMREIPGGLKSTGRWGIVELAGVSPLRKKSPHKNQKAHEVTRDVTAWASRVLPLGALASNRFL
jgi:hypothetical protein